jgi:hypothetical protein
MSLSDSLTEEQLETILAQYVAAQTAVLSGGQSYTISSGGSTRTVTMADIGEINKQICNYSSALAEAKGNKGFQARPGW